MHFCVESVLQGISSFNTEDKTGTCEKPNSNSAERPLGADVWLYDIVTDSMCLLELGRRHCWVCRIWLCKGVDGHSCRRNGMGRSAKAAGSVERVREKAHSQWYGGE